MGEVLMDQPWHGNGYRKIPTFDPNLGDCVLETPTGRFVVRMVRGANWGNANWHWRIISQPEGMSAMTTSPRPQYTTDVYPHTYNDYHHAINYLEDRIYFAQQEGADRAS